MRRITLITITLAALVGAAGAWVLAGPWPEHRALVAIGDPDPRVRERGWAWLLAPAGSGAARASTRLEPVNARLDAAGDEALLHGGRVLRGHDLWGWSHQDPRLFIRELSLRAARPEEAQQQMAADALSTAPLDLEAELIVPLLIALVAADARPVRATAFEAGCGWAGPERGDLIAMLTVPESDHALRRRRELALGWCAPSPTLDLPGADTPVAVLEAALLRATMSDPADAAPLLAALERDGPTGALPYILRSSRDPAALAVLTRLADAGDPAAVRALQARRRHLDEAQARAVVNDLDRDPSTRRLAAWRWDRVPRHRLDELLALDPTEPDGSVYAAALLAERRLPRVEAAVRAEAWIRSFDDDEKRAGALLTALLGAPPDLLRRAYDVEDIGAVRTTQRLALWGLGVPPGPDDPLEFAHRTLHGADGDFNPDTALCMLLAGRAEALALLTSPPTEDWRRSVQQRAWLVERFVPSWHEAVGRPVGGSARGIRLHFDRLDALRLLQQRRIRFDAPSRTYTATADGAL